MKKDFTFIQFFKNKQTKQKKKMLLLVCWLVQKLNFGVGKENKLPGPKDNRWLQIHLLFGVIVLHVFLFHNDIYLGEVY